MQPREPLAPRPTVAQLHYLQRFRRFIVALPNGRNLYGVQFPSGRLSVHDEGSAEGGHAGDGRGTFDPGVVEELLKMYPGGELAWLD